jgi:flagellar basal-body rod protein FlgB
MNITVVDQVSSALSFATLRNQVIASNIAHRNTEGYQRLAAEFDAAMSSGSTESAKPARGRVTVDTSGTAPSLEEDMVALSDNTLKYQALVRALSRYFSIVGTVTGGGKAG